MNEFDRIKLINLARQIAFDKAALTEEEKQFNVLKKAVDAGNLPSEVLIKARSGIYADNPVNRKKGRVGTRYGKKAEGGDTYDLENGGISKETPSKIETTGNQKVSKEININKLLERASFLKDKIKDTSGKFTLVSEEIKNPQPNQDKYQIYVYKNGEKLTHFSSHPSKTGYEAIANQMLKKD